MSDSSDGALFPIYIVRDNSVTSFFPREQMVGLVKTGFPLSALFFEKDERPLLVLQITWLLTSSFRKNKSKPVSLVAELFSHSDFDGIIVFSEVEDFTLLLFLFEVVDVFSLDPFFPLPPLIQKEGELVLPYRFVR